MDFKFVRLFFIASAFLASPLSVTAQEAGSDVTSLISNSECTNGKSYDINGSSQMEAPASWTIYDVNNDYSMVDAISAFHINNWSLETENNGLGIAAPFTELYGWKKGFSSYSDNIIIAHDDITGVTPGEYTISVRIKMSDVLDGNDPTGLVFFVNNSEQIISSADCKSTGSAWYCEPKVSFNIPEGGGIITFGFKLNKANFSSLSFKDVKLFSNDLNAVNGIASTVDGPAKPVAYYDLSGRVVSASYKGIKIVKMSDGTSKKTHP